jgi:DNA-binding NtrC family response regulator
MTHRRQPTILVVEDDPAFRDALVESLGSSGFAAAEAADAADATDRLKGFAYDGLVIDLGLPDGNGLDVLEEAVARYPGISAVVITGYGGVAEAVSAMKRGAADFLIKPFPLADLSRVLRVRQDQEENTASAGSTASTRRQFRGIIGQHATMQRLFGMVELVSPMTSTVLLQGETGTGKELIARTIHEHSPRREQPFVAFNAAAIPETLAEAELFGHVKGAFTGAIASRAGRFELAHRGTLFIDEVASMSLPLQAKLLRALQQKEVERVGDSRSVKLDIRLIAATNMDLQKLVKDGAFREDLYYRLHVIPVTLPPLRERREDIPLLAHEFVRKSCRSNGLPPKTLNQEALRMLMACEWPGNVRQLENAIEHAVAMSAAAIEVGPTSLPPEIRAGSCLPAMSPVSIPDEGINFTSVVSQLERELILRCLEKTGGNKRRAARLLNLSRTTFIDKLQRLNGTVAGAA